MVNDPLFIKTKHEILNWKKHKQFKGQKIPNDLRDQIKILLAKYPRSKITQGLELSASTIATLINRTAKKSIRKKTSKIKYNNDALPSVFHQIPAKTIENKVALLSFEIEFPGKFILRLFK
ncbi:MAG: hypothetical protein WC688_07310 [Parachlamydiales bacterium]|jgi:hypothetical protein